MHAPVALPFFCVALVHLVGAKLDSGVKVFGSTYAAERPHKQIYTPKSNFSGPRSLSHAPTMSVLLEQCQPGRRKLSPSNWSVNAMRFSSNSRGFWKTATRAVLETDAN